MGDPTLASSDSCSVRNTAMQAQLPNRQLRPRLRCFAAATAASSAAALKPRGRGRGALLKAGGGRGVSA